MSASKGPRPYSIYALLDPRDSPPSVRYIGATKGIVETRVAAHVSDAIRNVGESTKEEWLRSLIRENHEPLFTLLERVSASTDWEERERFWIARYRGPLLTNEADGGAGSPGSRRLAQTKAAISRAFRGGTLTEEHRRKISDAKMGHAVSDETRAKLAEAMTGRKHSAETVEKRRRANAGYTHDDEARAKISAARRAMKLGPLPEETKAKLRAVMNSLVWVTDGQVNRRIPKTDPIPRGWRRGRA